MAAFTSVTSGNWNDGATWGMTSPGVKGTDWPGSAIVADTFTVAAGHTVTYNVSETNELGASAINGVLSFSTGANTLLRFNHNNLTIGATGELRMGASGAAIPATYTAKLEFNTTSDGTKGITINAGGKLVTEGDPAYYGSTLNTTLASNWTSGASFTTTDDMSALWSAGQTLLVHKYTTYSSYLTDVVPVTISSISGTTVNVNFVGGGSFPGGTFYAGGMVVNVSRNVMLGKYITDTPPIKINNSGSLYVLPSKPYLNDSNTSGSASSIVSKYTDYLGWYWIRGYRAVFDECVAHNGFFGWYEQIASQLNNCIVYANTFGAIQNRRTTHNMICCANSYTGQSLQGGSLAGKYFGNATFFGGNISNNVVLDDPDIFSNSNAFGSLCGFTGKACIYYNSYVFSATFTGIKLIDSILGYDRSGTSRPNSTDIYFAGQGSAVLENCKVNLVLSSRNTFPYGTRIGFDHYNQTLNDMRVLDAFGTLTKVAADGSGSPANPEPRSAELDYCLQVDTQTLCNAESPMMVLNPEKFKTYCTSGEEKEIRIYLQSTDALDETQIKLNAAYLDGVTATSRTTVSSADDAQGIDARADETDWSQYLAVTFIPGADGFVELELLVTASINSSTSDYVWVWPLPIEVCETPIHYGISWSGGEPVTYQKDQVDANLIADAVWEKATSDPMPSGSYGEKVGELKSAYAWKRTS